MQSQHKENSAMNKIKDKGGLMPKIKQLFQPSASRAPSPAPSFANTAANEGMATSNVASAVIQASNALVAPGAPGALLAMPIGEDLLIVAILGQGINLCFSGPQGLVGPITSPTQSLALLTDNQPTSLPSISVDASPGIGITPASDPDPSFEATDHVPASKAKEVLGTAWHGFTMLLGKVEGLLEGTPFQTPVAAVNVLIQLGK
ncbi:hypothetical protein H0H92_014911, partial [Tricholoma furcatifolium]